MPVKARSALAAFGTGSRDRGEPQFYNLFDLPWQSYVEHETVHGLEARLVTRSPVDGASSYLVRIPPGWRRTLKAVEATAEWFVLEGDLSLSGRGARAGGFLALPEACGPARLSSARGASAYLFVTPRLALPTYTAGIHSSNVWQEPWIAATLTGMRHGVMSKSLRVPDVRGTQLVGGASGMLRLVMMTPGFVEPRNEVHHNCWEEVIILGGDMLVGDRGRMAPGSILANPPNLWHAPMASQRGCVFFLHSDAPMDVEYRPYRGGFDLCCDQVETLSWLEEPRHETWDPPLPHLYFTHNGGETT